MENERRKRAQNRRLGLILLSVFVALVVFAVIVILVKN